MSQNQKGNGNGGSNTNGQNQNQPKPQLTASQQLTVATENGPRALTTDDITLIIQSVSATLNMKGLSQTTSPAPSIDSVEQYKAEDHLTTPVVFFSLRTGYIDYGAKRGDGTYHLPPFFREDVMPDAQGQRPRKPIEFKYSHTEAKINIGKQSIEKLQFCSFVCRNKKELDYLESHPLLGVEFYRATDGHTTKNTQQARAIADAHMEVEPMKNDVVIERLTAMGGEVSHDMQKNRTALMHLLAEQRLKQEENTLIRGLELSAGGINPRERVVEAGSKEYKQQVEALQLLKDE